MAINELEKLSIEDIRLYDEFEKKEKCALCNSVENYELQILNAISSDLVMDLDFFPKFGVEYTFCDYHLNKIESTKDKLGIAIMLKKLIKLEIKRLEKGDIENTSNRLFIKKSNTKKCFVCEKVNLEAMKNDLEITIKLWKNIQSFRENFKNQQYFCYNHSRLLLATAKKLLTKKEFEEFKQEIIEVQLKYSNSLESDLEWFINKFDYRYANEPWKNAKDSIYRAREILKMDTE